MLADTVEQLESFGLLTDMEIVRGKDGLNKLITEMANDLGLEKKQEMLETAHIHASGLVTCLYFGPLQDKYGMDFVFRFYEKLGYSQKLFAVARGFYCKVPPYPGHCVVDPRDVYSCAMFSDGTC